MSGEYKAPENLGFWHGFKQLKEVRNFQDFGQWFGNVFWYHYKLPLLATLIGIAVVVYVIVSFVTAVRPDATVLFATKYGFYTEPVEELAAELGAAAGAEDRPLTVDLAALNIGGEGEMAYASRMKFAAMLTQPDVLLLILDLDEIEKILEDDPECFLPLDDIGLPGQTLVDARALPGLAVLQLQGDQDISAGIVARLSATPEQYDAALAMLRYLMTRE